MSIEPLKIKSIDFTSDKSLEELCLNLAFCESEKEVIEILKEIGLWSSSEDWKFYGDTVNNFATIGNQQSLPESALVEKIINSVDAVLMLECLKRGINPEGEEAPKNIIDALIKFFNISDGKLYNITTSERISLSENINLVATGSKSNPCYSIIDKGEGQTPNKIPDTFLSLGRDNKLRIPFVQGKFNMGGTGVLQFCGKNNLQLIISRRHPEIAKFENDKLYNEWGFTIVRREDPAEGVRNSVYTYLAPNGKIPSFKSDGLPLLPSNYPNPYGGKLEWGTFIKLYEYQMPGGLKTIISFDLYNRLSLLVPSIALPVRFYERRSGYSGHSFESTLAGLSVRLEEDKRENLEEGYPDSSTISALGQKMKVSVYAFKKGGAEKYVKDEGIIFTINGQTHGYIPKYFFERTSVGMGYLKDSLLVIADCTEFDGRAKEDLFMNSRDRLRAGELKTQIERSLTELIKNHPGLKILRVERRREEIENKLSDSKPLKDAIEDIVKRSPSLLKLFKDGIRLPNPFKLKTTKKKMEYRGKRFPTFFKLSKSYELDNPKICAINRRFRIQYQTDVSNDYFYRDSEPGRFILLIDGNEVHNYSINLWDGTATLNVELPKEIKINNILSFKSEVSDSNRVEPFTEDFHIKVGPPEKKLPGIKGERKKSSSDEEGKDVETTSFLDLPNVIDVRRNDWGVRGFDEFSVLDVINTGENDYDFFINLDNIHLLTELKIKSSINEELIIARYKYGMVLVGIALLKDYSIDKNRIIEEQNEEKDISSIIRYVTKVLSPILLPMIDSLGSLDD